MLAAALRALAVAGVPVLKASRIVETPPLGPSRRRYANCVAAVRWSGTPEALLARLQAIEQQFGRKRWRRWGERVLDLDLLAFGQLQLSSRRLTLPHPEIARRLFVLAPLLEVAPDWRHPASGLRVRQMAARLSRGKPLA